MRPYPPQVLQTTQNVAKPAADEVAQEDSFKESLVLVQHAVRRRDERRPDQHLLAGPAVGEGLEGFFEALDEVGGVGCESRDDR